MRLRTGICHSSAMFCAMEDWIFARPPPSGINAETFKNGLEYSPACKASGRAMPISINAACSAGLFNRQISTASAAVMGRIALPEMKKYDYDQRMAAGCVVVGSRVVGVQEVVRPGDNGLLAAHADPESLADALQQALQDDEAALRMAATARQEALSHYSLQRMTGQYEDLFARLLQGERP